jgi:hypothetical protein
MKARSALVLSGLFATITAYAVEQMKYPANSSCEEHYVLLEGVCVHATALRGSAEEMKAAIAEFKKTGVPPKAASEASQAPLDDQARCEKYRKILRRYEERGVMGVNAAGKMEKMEGEAAEQVIANARENVEIFCEGLESK